MNKRSKFLFFLIPIVLIVFNLTETHASVILNKESPTELPINACTTPSCQNAIKKLEKRMDPTVEPCDDFYQFACGTLINSTNSDYEISTDTSYEFAEMQEKIDEQLIISSLEKDDHINDTKPIKIIKNLYKSCVNKSMIGEQGLTSFLNTMEQIGGWPVLKGDTWNEDAFDWTKLIFKFGNETYWDNNFFPILPKQDKLNRTQFTIHVLEPNWGVPKIALVKGTENDEVQNYLKYMIDTAVSMGANEAYAKDELNKVLDFEIILAQKTIAGMKIMDPDDFNKNYLKYVNTPTNLFMLKKIFPAFPWEDYIKRNLPLNVTLANTDVKIIVSNLHYIKRLSFYIHMNYFPKRTIANYFIWKKIMRYGYFLSENIHNIKENYENVKANNDDNNSDVKKEKTPTLSKQCLELVSLTAKKTVTNLYIRDNLIDKNTEANVATIFDNIRNEFTELLKNAKWIDGKSKKRLIEKTMKISRKIDYSQDEIDDSMLDEYLQNLEIPDDNYFMYLIKIQIYNEKKMWEELGSMATEKSKDWNDWGKHLTTPNAFYRSTENSVLIIPGLLHGVIYNDDFPKYINYGKFGFILGHEIAHSFDLFGYRYDEKLEMIDWPVTAELIYLKKAQCIMNQYTAYNEIKKLSNVTKTIREDVTDNSGIRAIYNAYKKISMMDASQELKNKNYTPEQLFWISTANLWCEKPSVDYLEADHSPSNYRINGVFSNLDEFSNDFNCPKDSPMNQLAKCRIF